MAGIGMPPTFIINSLFPERDIEHVNTVTSNNLKKSVVERYPKLFIGVGKLKNVQLRIPIDEAAEPVQVEYPVY
jgi:hypothetical protein